MSERVEAAIIPPSIADERGKAFGEAMARAIADPDFRGLLFERIDTVDESLLPFLVREFSLERIVEPGMSAGAVRDLIKNSFALHARKGFIDGVRAGLAFIGLRILSWRQWFEQQPAGAPGTHIVTLSLDRIVFTDDASVSISFRLQRVVSQIVGYMKRASQDVGIRFQAATSTPFAIGVQPVSRITIRPNSFPSFNLTAQPSVFVAAFTVTRLRIRPQVPNA